MRIARSLAPLALWLVAPAPALAQSVVRNLDSLDGIDAIDDGKITPDGRYLVVREDWTVPIVRVLDMQTGNPLRSFHPASIPSPRVRDAVAVTNERAVVLADRMAIVDLTDLQAPLIARRNVGPMPRDLELTPDGTLVAVRGGSTSGNHGGLYVFDLATGVRLLQAPGEPNGGDQNYGTDSVAVTDEHAVFTSSVGSDQGRVTIVALHPAGGGPPAVVYETSPGSDLWGLPHDVAITPDGRHAAVRSDQSIGVYRLDGPNTHMVFAKRLFENPGPYGLSAMDSVEVTNERVATISRLSSGGIGAQVDVFDLQGNQAHEQIDGDPHDLQITPNGERLVLRTHSHLYLYDLTSIPANGQLAYLARSVFTSTHTSYGAGLNSLIVTDEQAVALARQDEDTRLGFWDLRGDALSRTADHLFPERPIDLTYTPSISKVIVALWSRALVFDARTGSLLLEWDSAPEGGYPWCSGVATNENRAAVFGYAGNPPGFGEGGWITLIDLFDEPTNYCDATPNSTGSSASLYATGSASIAANNLRVVAQDVPAGQLGAFVYGSHQSHTSFGNGFRCVTGLGSFFPIQATNDAGFAELWLDVFDLPPGGLPISPGSTWYFQFAFRDPAAGAASFNATDGLEVAFGI